MGSVDTLDARLALPNEWSKLQRRNDMTWTLREETYPDEGGDINEDLSNQPVNDEDD